MLAGCQRIFQIAPLANPDAPRDGTADVATDSSGSDGPPPACWDMTRTGDDDGDGIMDGCDPCPGNAAKATASDTDLDGIPDICDPEAGPNTVLMFLPLHDLTGWTNAAGSWSTDGVDVAETAVPATTSLLEYGTPIPANAWVQLRVVGPSTPTTADTAVGIYLDAIASRSLTQGIACSVQRSSTGTTRNLVGATFSSGSASTSALVPFGANSATEMWLYVRSNPVGCMADLGTGLRIVAPPPGGINRQPELALTTAASTGVFESITVFSSTQ